MADLSVQTCVVLSEGYNQVVVHGSCGLVDAIPHVRSSFPVLLFWFLLQRLRLLFLIVSLVYVFMPALSTPELGPFSLVSSLWFSKDALGESVLRMVINRLGVSLWFLFAFPGPLFPYGIMWWQA
ncbi:hypothetical protein Bca52824_031543 [Brassica carinata]|uniref:Uncharacterized protein n=1 Tax=Brassica carinata TaxID=52824 RepID=A0A8X7SBF4_BRACI|nr:hypothetical protein Bca52824_031543 [Brassica carinata]